MSKQMTPCEKLGYKVGDKFKVVDGTGVLYAVGSFITLIHDDGTSCPRFNGVHATYESGDSFFPLDSVEKVAKLKPAKQALADAIHQNGGWICGKYAVYGKQSGKCTFLTCKPQYITKDHGWLVKLSWIVSEFEMKPFINWHQCILSRGEYFIAYPEQVKAWVKNETKHKVGVEMESESEVTIKVSDWHKNGELPPVGEICEIHHSCWNESKFEKVKIAAITKDYLIVEYATFEQHYLRKDMSFLSLRTERDKAIDEMMEHCDCLGSRDFAGKLFDAGYRKEVK